MVDEAETQSKSGSIKIISGWADADVSANLPHIDLPKHGNAMVTPAATRFDRLKEIAQMFKAMKDQSPRVFTILHPHITAWGVREFIFNSMKTSESRGKRVISCALEFDEFDSVAGKSQDRRLGAAADTTAVTSENPVIGDETRMGLGKLEAEFAKL